MRSWIGYLLVALLAVGCNSCRADLNSEERVAAFAKLPDWSGVWERFNVGVTGAPSNPEERERFVAALREMHPPYNAEWEEKYRLALSSRNPSELGPLKCDPQGFPQAMLFPAEMLQFIAVPEVTTIMFYTGGGRHIVTDGSALPPTEERWGARWGHSVGRWDGSVLIVDTVSSNSPIITSDRLEAWFSDQIHVSERIRNIDENTLENQMTINDPVALIRPWNLTIRYHRIPGLRHLTEYHCLTGPQGE